MAAIFTDLKSLNESLANVGVHVCQEAANLSELRRCLIDYFRVTAHQNLQRAI